MEVSEYGVAWLSLEYVGVVGGMYLCVLNTCMGEGGKAWSVRSEMVSVSNKSLLREGIEIGFSSVRFSVGGISCH